MVRTIDGRLSLTENTLKGHRGALSDLVAEQRRVVLTTIVTLTPHLGHPPTPGAVTMLLVSTKLDDAFPLQGELNYLRRGEVGTLVSNVIRDGLAVVLIKSPHRGRLVLTTEGRQFLAS